ncbi:hypothetical protein EDS67_04645 [candidate division KSB1 bacterium]|nr:MAG: hypothetical protein EDS67_04645 [candidate division KSB1 bacterium]MBC6947408.1 hypothetical protein [candidate division KSB1 bacterium]MCE7940561.1 hypothetical protein [Chlorobi bacterium CHB1]
MATLNYRTPPRGAFLRNRRQHSDNGQSDIFKLRIDTTTLSRSDNSPKQRGEMQKRRATPWKIGTQEISPNPNKGVKQAF